MPHAVPRILYLSRRAGLLRLVAVLVTTQAALTLWLVTLPPRTDWPAPLGGGSWWLLPSGLVALSLVLPGAMVWLHGRYVIRIEEVDATLQVTLFTWWGERQQSVSLKRLAGADKWEVAPFGTAPGCRLRLPAEKVDWLIDRQGEFPEGEDSFCETLRGARDR